MTHYQITHSAELESLALFRDLVDLACNQTPGIDEQICYDIKLAVDEACTNIILHGYAGMDPGSIMLFIDINPEAVTITIRDFGHPFEPVEVSIGQSLQEQEREILGLFLMHQSTDRIDYESTDGVNNLTLLKYLNKDDIKPEDGLHAD
jgi:serine/threonine-protein kinase RsbW